MASPRVYSIKIKFFRDERFGVRPWIVWATGLLAYIVAVLDRTTLGVSGLDAADRFNASPSVLSTFVVLQVIVYAGAQVPAGLLLDRFGSKALIVCRRRRDGVRPAGAGVHRIPARGHRAHGRCVGLGDALTFISVLRLVPHWFSPAAGPAGDPADRHLRPVRPGALGASRSSRCSPAPAGPPPTSRSAALGVLAMVLALALVKNTPHGRVVPRDTRRCATCWPSVKTVWLRPGTRLGFFTHMGTQFSVTVFALMWGVPYLTVAQGLSRAVAGALLTVSVVAAISSGILIGIFTGPVSAPPVTPRARRSSSATRWSGRWSSRCPRRGAAVAAGGPDRGHLGRRPRLDGRVRLRPDVQPERRRWAPRRAWSTWAASSPRCWSCRRWA